MTWKLTPVLVNARGKTRFGTTVTLLPTGYETLAGGVGGWEHLPRPRRTAATAWVGGTEQFLTLPCMVNGIDAAGPGRNRGVEKLCKRIFNLGRKHQSMGEPPRLRVRGVLGVPASWRWVVEDIEWGPAIRGNTGVRVQQELTITLRRWREPSLVKGPAKKSRQRKKKK